MTEGVEPNFISTLGLNWKLFLAQAVNFGIVVFILWKWVFRPVVGALEARRQRIEESVKTAEEIERRLKEFEAKREEEMRKAAAQAEAIIKKVSEAAETSKRETLALAKQEGQRILAEARAAIEAEKEQMFREVREEAANLTVMATEKILRQKLDEIRDKKLIEEAVGSIKK